VTYSYAWQDCDSTGANCTTISGGEGTEYKPTPADVGHTIRAVVTAIDTDGDTQLTTSQSSLVLPTQGSLGAGPGGGSAIGGTPGVPNGAFASENALLYLGVPATISESYQRRAFRLNGRLLNKEGHPILGANIEVTQQLAGSTQTTAVATVKTGETGEFSLRIPAGPSRTITVSYSALSTDTAFSARAQIRETVPAYLMLTVSPHHAGRHGTVTFRGTVAGPIPPGGVWVDLRVRYRGHWQFFAHVHTDQHGRFNVKYKFQGGIGSYPFRAEISDNQTGFSYAPAHSRSTYVRTS
jgi:5-hydroxyisourate hydrolase-like protein (transthyretin family)